MALKLRSRKCTQPRSCNETWSWKQCSRRRLWPRI